MVLGRFAAIGQTNIKRLMAYSSIGHMGYALIGLAAARRIGVRGVLVYMAIYLFMNLGTFAVILCMRRNGKMLEASTISPGCRAPIRAGAGARHLHVLDGRHSAAGRLLRQALHLPRRDRRHLTRLAVIGVLASVVGAFYYLRIVKVMYFDEPALRPPDPCRA
jgi:NADH-quinone oxidoreductase subunit N